MYVHRTKQSIIVGVAIVLYTFSQHFPIRIYESQVQVHSPMTRLGRSIISLRIEKQNVHGTGEPFGLSKTQCEYTDCVVFSNA